MKLMVASHIGKRNTIHLPPKVVEEAQMQEGMKVLITVERDQIIIDPLRDPITLAVEGKKFATTTFEEIEDTSQKEQSKYIDGA